MSSSTIIDSYTKGDDLYIKYFLIDSSFNNRGWSVDPTITERLAHTAVGKPFTDYEDFPTTPFNDGHPWSPKPNATLKDHLEHASNNATGVIVDFSPVSRNALKSASGHNIQQNNGYYVTVKVLKEDKKKLYLQNPDRIPKVSPGIFDYDFTQLPATNLKNVDIVHLAGVREGAYGDKARMYAKCSGGYECLNHLKGASNDEKKDYNSSLGNSIENTLQDNIMVETTNNNNNNTLEQQQQPQQQPKEQEAKVETVTNNANNNTNANNNIPTGSPIERLKTQNNKQVIEIKQPNWKEDPELQKLIKEHEELKAKAELREQYEKYAEIIPRELFILNGKFDSAGYNKEIEKAVEKKLDPDYAKELYNLKLNNVKLGNKLGKPFGASSNSSDSSNNYNTPDQVPELKGASNDNNNNNSSQFQSIINLTKMLGLSNTAIISSTVGGSTN